MSSFAPLKLVYFDARGVVEVARCMLAMNNITYEDHRFPINFSPDGKFLYPEFTAAKERGELLANMDR